jgi:hypothetical protein
VILLALALPALTAVSPDDTADLVATSDALLPQLLAHAPILIELLGTERDVENELTKNGMHADMVEQQAKVLVRGGMGRPDNDAASSFHPDVAFVYAARDRHIVDVDLYERDGDRGTILRWIRHGEGYVLESPPGVSTLQSYERKGVIEARRSPNERGGEFFVKLGPSWVRSQFLPRCSMLLEAAAEEASLREWTMHERTHAYARIDALTPPMPSGPVHVEIVEANADHFVVEVKLNDGVARETEASKSYVVLQKCKDAKP